MIVDSVNLTIALPRSVHSKMKQHNEISWSAAIRNMIEQKLRDIELLDSLTKNSRLTEDDVAFLAEKMDKSAAKKLGLA